jgi:LacI family transcriptional regulator
MTLTIEHVAALARVSRSTVSRVLNEQPGVRSTVRERMLRIVREQNYTPRAAWRVRGVTRLASSSRGVHPKAS